MIQTTNPMDKAQKFIAELKKVETHIHLDGTLTPELIKTLAIEQQYMPLMNLSLEEIASKCTIHNRRTLSECLSPFFIIHPLLKNTKALFKVAYELIRSLNQYNVTHVEVRFAPAFHGLPYDQVISAVLDGLKQGQIEFGITSSVIICMMRSYVTMESNREALMAAIRFKDKGVSAIDLAGDEASQPLSDFVELYKEARQHGLLLTVHAGEIPNSPDLSTAIDVISVDRIGHATYINDYQLAQCAARKIMIEICITSNLRTGAVESVTDHPVFNILKLYPELVLLSTDDPGLFSCNINDEYLLLWMNGVSLDTLSTISKNGV